MAEQITFFEEPVKLAKVKHQWSIYAVPRYYDGTHIETIMSAYSEKQARWLFHQLRKDYRIIECYRIN